jgi:hypothetical protein
VAALISTYAQSAFDAVASVELAFRGGLRRVAADQLQQNLGTVFDVDTAEPVLLLRVPWRTPATRSADARWREGTALNVADRNPSTAMPTIHLVPCQGNSWLDSGPCDDADGTDRDGNNRSCGKASNPLPLIRMH